VLPTPVRAALPAVHPGGTFCVAHERVKAGRRCPRLKVGYRLTIGLCKVDGAWRIQHEDHSVPATDQKNQSGDRLRRYFELLFRPAIRRRKETA
jgi:hypothetical protein